jgi:DNA-binding NarL/FixJ family response regulator
MQNSLIKIFIADDHNLFRTGIISLIENEKIGDVIGEVSNGKELLLLLQNNTPDIILMDIDMPVLNGIETTKEALRKYPELNILALSMFSDQKYYTQMIEAGVKGFILKTANLDELEEAISKVSKGENYFSREILESIVKNISINRKQGIFKEEKIKFSKNEIALLQNICKGLTSNQIADKMFLSPKTIENYRVKLLQKTNSNSSISLVVYAIKNNLVEI